MKMKKADYGIDAPGVIRNLFIFSAIGFLGKFCFPVIKIGNVIHDVSGSCVSAKLSFVTRRLSSVT